MTKKKLIEDIKLAPQRFYRSPTDVLRDRRLGDGERWDVLSAWREKAPPDLVREVDDTIEALKNRGLTAAE